MWQWLKDWLRIGYLGTARSSKWPKLEKTHLQKQPLCQLCGGNKKLSVHHIKPFHLHPELELESDNLITLCEGKKFVNCHLFFGHLGNYKSYNINVIEDVKNWNQKIKNRP